MLDFFVMESFKEDKFSFILISIKDFNLQLCTMNYALLIRMILSPYLLEDVMYHLKLLSLLHCFR